MNIDKRIVVLTVAVACLVVMVFLQGNLFSISGPSGQMIGSRLWEKDLPLNQVTQITLESGSKSCRLHRGPERWQVQDRYEYCADFERITKLLKKINRLKVGFSFSADKDTLERLKLDGPPETKTWNGIHIVMQDKGDLTLADLVIGKQRQTASGGGGQFIRFSNSKTVYLVDESFRFLNAGPEYWIQDDLLSVNPDQISKVECFDANGKMVYRIDHPDDKKTARLANVPDDRMVSQPKIDQILDAINPLKISDVIGPAPTGSNKFPHLVYYLRNGSSYTVFLLPTQKADLYQLLLKKEPPQSSQAEAGTKGPGGCARLADPDLWSFGVEKWQFESFITDYDQLFETPSS